MHPLRHQLLGLLEHRIPVFQLFASGVHVGAPLPHGPAGSSLQGRESPVMFLNTEAMSPSSFCTDFSLGFLSPLWKEVASSSSLSVWHQYCVLPLGTWRRMPGENLQLQPVLCCLAPCPRPWETSGMLSCWERKHFAEGRPLPLLPCTPGKSIRQYCLLVSYHWGEAHGNSHGSTVTVTTETHPGPSMLIWKAWRNADNITASTGNELPDVSNNLPRRRSTFPQPLSRAQ